MRRNRQPFFRTATRGLNRALNIDAKATLITHNTSVPRGFHVRDWSVFEMCNAGQVQRIVVMCEVVSDRLEEWRECHVNYSLDFIERNELQVEEDLILHARAQIVAELNHVFGSRDWSSGEQVIEIECA